MYFFSLRNKSINFLSPPFNWKPEPLLEVMISCMHYSNPWSIFSLSIALSTAVARLKHDNLPLVNYMTLRSHKPGSVSI